jgi:hypothetical protein
MYTPVKAKQVELTLKQKKEVLEKVEKGVPYRQIQQEFKCSLGSITKIKNNKRVIEEAIEENQPSCKRRLYLRRTANYDINVLMWKWFNEVRSRNIPVSGVIIRQKAGHKRHGNIVDATIDEVVTNNYTSLSHLLESRQLCSIIDSDFVDEGLPSYATFSYNNWEEELIENYIGEIKDLENEDEDEDSEIIEDQPRKIKTKSEVISKR